MSCGHALWRRPEHTLTCQPPRAHPLRHTAAGAARAGAANSSAWGFTTAYDPVDQLYHAVVDVSCGCGPHSAVRECSEFTGVLASGGYASTLVHLQARAWLHAAGSLALALALALLLPHTQ